MAAAGPSASLRPRADPSDTDLLAAVLARRRGAWDEFVRAVAPGLLASVRRALRSGGGVAQDAAEDVVQDVFIRLCQNDYGLLRRYDPSRARLSTWLGVVAGSAAHDHLRRQRRWQPTSSGLGGASSLDAVPEPAAEAETAQDATDLPEIPRDMLSPRQTLVLELLYDRDLDVGEAAVVLGVDPQTVRSLRHKALEKLRRHFGVGGETGRRAGQESAGGDDRTDADV